MSVKRKNLKNFYEEQSFRINQWDYIHSGFGRNIHKVRLKMSLKYLGLKENNHNSNTILDIGCGDGIFTVEIIKRLKSKVIGCDLSSYRIYKLKELLKKIDLWKETELIICDSVHLPFRERSIQKILCHHVLEHIPQDDSTIQEIRRVLQINGVSVIGVPNENVSISKIRSYFWWSKLTLIFGSGWSGHVNKYSLASIQNKLHKNGLKVIAKSGIGLALPLIPIHYLLLSVNALFLLGNLIGHRFPVLSDSLLFKAVKKCQ